MPTTSKRYIPKFPEKANASARGHTFLPAVSKLSPPERRIPHATSNPAEKTP
jgi:hypothetical protein